MWKLGYGGLEIFTRALIGSPIAKFYFLIESGFDLIAWSYDLFWCAMKYTARGAPCGEKWPESRDLFFRSRDWLVSRSRRGAWVDVWNALRSFGVTCSIISGVRLRNENFWVADNQQGPVNHTVNHHKTAANEPRNGIILLFFMNPRSRGVKFKFKESWPRGDWFSPVWTGVKFAQNRTIPLVTCPLGAFFNLTTRRRTGATFQT